MRARPIRRFAHVIVALALLVAACGGDDSTDAGDSENTTSAAAVSESTPTSAPEGGEDGDVGSSDVSDGDSEPSDDADSGGDLSLVPPGETDILGNPAGQGFVELDGTRYDFVLNGACQKIFGAVQAAGASPDDDDVTVDSVIPPEDWETDTAAGWDPPYVAIDIGDDTWRAQAGVEHFVGGETVELSEEQSAVVSFTNNGSRVTGTGNFFRLFNVDEIETLSGSFEFFCP